MKKGVIKAPKVIDRNYLIKTLDEKLINVRKFSYLFIK